MKKDIKNMKGCTNNLGIPVYHLVYSGAWVLTLETNCSKGIPVPIRAPSPLPSGLFQR